MQQLKIGILLFPDITILDAIGPAEVFASIQNIQVDFVWKTLHPVATSIGTKIYPTVELINAPLYDVICIPGGSGQISLMDDIKVINFIKIQARSAKYITSICTGSLLLGAAGLLKNRQATCHWMSLDQLSLFGAIPIKQRIVIDKNIITAAGVSSGIDFAIMLISILYGEDTAKEVQLRIEYDPDPPFDAGSPDKISPDILNRIVHNATIRQEKRLLASKLAASKL